HRGAHEQARATRPRADRPRRRARRRRRGDRAGVRPAGDRAGRLRIYAAGRGRRAGDRRRQPLRRGGVREHRAAPARPGGGAPAARADRPRPRRAQRRRGSGRPRGRSGDGARRGEPAAADARGASSTLHDRRDLQRAARRVRHVRRAALPGVSAVLDYHRATNVAAYGTDEDEERMVDARPSPFKDYGDAERLPLEASVAGPLLQEAAGIVRSQQRRDYGGGTIHWRAYSSAGALYPIDSYVASADGLFAFDVLTPSLVALSRADARQGIAAAAAEPERAGAGAVVVVTGIHKRTGWKYLERG